MEFFGKMGRDHVTAYSAMSAYFMLMSFVPFIMLLLILATYLPFSKEIVMDWMTSIAIIKDNTYIMGILEEIYRHATSTLMGVTIVSMVWSASKGVWAIIMGLNSVYDIEETRNAIWLRIIAIFYTIAFLVIIIVSLVLLVFGTTIYQYILTHYPMLEHLANAIMDIKSFFSIFVLTIFFLMLYILIPARKTTIKNELIGAIFSAIGWSLFSFVFSIYVSRFSNYTYVYGGLGAILLFLLWLYMIMYIMFIGAELNFFLSEKGLHRIRTFLSLGANASPEMKKRKTEE
jgi:membrane protein